VRTIVEVSVIPSMYLHHLSDPEMRVIYYFWGGRYYRLQTRFVNGSCIALIPNRGCTLGDNRPLICRVWPFWWGSEADLSSESFPIEIDGDCTMAVLWNMSPKEILREFGCSERDLRKDLLKLSKALKEHENILKEAKDENVPPKRLLDWIISKAL